MTDLENRIKTLEGLLSDYVKAQDTFRIQNAALTKRVETLEDTVKKAKGIMVHQDHMLQGLARCCYVLAARQDQLNQPLGGDPYDFY
jgi:hypothetical protein